ncbi:hypothetical protein JHK84_043769 [Glycine max]|nr:hypothetical protein JHK84_043769 [Glycine max]
MIDFDRWKWELSSVWYAGALERTLNLTDYWWTSRSLFTTVEGLSLAKLKGVKDLYDLDVDGFPQLSICISMAKVNCCTSLTQEGNLSQLHEIEISSCKGMTEIIAVEKQEDQKELLQIDLPELHSVTLRGLPELQSLYCSVTVDQGNPSGQSNTLALFNQQVVTPKLETLKLYRMNLCKIWDDKLPMQKGVAMDVIANVPGVSEIANYVITFIKGQIGYISSYDENLEKLITEVQTLKDTQDSVQHRVVEAERNGDKIENIVQNWLKKANDIVTAANKVIDVEGARWCLGQYCPYLWTRCQLSKSFEKMTKEISDVIEKGKFDTISYRDAPDVTITPFSRGYEALESRNQC